MLDLAWIRSHGENLDASMKKRGLSALSDHLLQKDTAHRHLLTQLQDIRTQRNALADVIRELKQKQLPCQEKMDLSIALKEKEQVLEHEVSILHHELQDLLSRIPNVLDPMVVYGESENDNVVIRQWGEKPVIQEPKDHIQLGKSLDGLDVEQAVLMSGSRFVVLKGFLAQLERALAQWMLTVHVERFQRTEVSVPFLVRRKAVYGAGQLPKFEEDLFKVTDPHGISEDDRFLISTSEVSLVNLARDKVYLPHQLPLRWVCFSPCFRSEAGAAGKDTHGILRLHQFNKVEMVTYCLPHESEEEHQRIVEQAEFLLQALGLPYRVVLLCSGDTGFCSQKTYDLEVWVPSQNKYREISSCSNCGDFQSRRLNARYRDEGLGYIHMLNGSGLPTGRTLLALLENYQQPDGSVVIPTVLRPYMGGREVLQPC